MGMCMVERQNRIMYHQSINNEYYTNILNTYLLLVMPRGSRYLFQQDNPTPHKAHHTQNWLLTNKFRVLPNWPTHSPEFHAIEYIWSWMAAKVNMMVLKNQVSLIRAFKITWKNLSQKTIR